jgi:hypothetical protein
MTGRSSCQFESGPAPFAGFAGRNLFLDNLEISIFVRNEIKEFCNTLGRQAFGIKRNKFRIRNEILNHNFANIQSKIPCCILQPQSGETLVAVKQKKTLKLRRSDI